MALSARVPSTIGTYKFIPALYSKQVAEAVHSRLVCWNLIDSRFKKELTKGDILYIPKTNAITATEVVVGTASAALNPFNTAAVTLTVNQWHDAVVPIDDMSARQAFIDPFEYAKKESTYAIAKKMDTTINVLFSALNSGTVLGTDGAEITDNVLIAAWELLSKNDVPETDRCLIVNPSGVADFMKNDKLVNTLYGGSPTVTTAGFSGFHKVYGCPVYMTNNLTNATTGAYGVMMHKEAIAGVAQEEFEVELYDLPDQHQIKVITTALWGVIEVRGTFGVPIYTRSR